MEMKTCYKCNTDKPISEFKLQKSGKPMNQCHACLLIHKRLYHCKNKEKLNESRMKWYYANKERAKLTKRKNTLMRRYGLDIEQYEFMVESQNGICAICGRNDSKLVIDHNHSTGKVRALLCCRCNTWLGVLEADRVWLSKAHKYLEDFG